ncbi:hypothetical protein [Parabacteroides merdae]|uniref:hypothetical protein n=1 Tax=Parabacteroides merdae TaxID=46503 RepID=UPI00189A2682|nr:hypothetical protein [Parabacteroides merdae]
MNIRYPIYEGVYRILTEELARAGAGIANNANTVIIIGGELKPGIRTPEVNAFKLTRHP